MDLAQIKELMRAMGKHNMHRLEVKDGDFSLKLEHSCGVALERAHSPAPVLSMVPPPASPVLPAAVKPGEPSKEMPKKEEGTFIKSPMVGTFYTSPSPDEPIFVRVGDKVSAGSVVCIIEAMKVMNEVKAGVSGTVAEVLIDNGHPVEFGSKLFRITPE